MSTRTRSQAAADIEAVRHKAPVTDRVNVEASILNGMNMPEAQVIGAVSLVVFLIIGGLVFSVTRLWQVWLLLSLIGPTLALWFGRCTWRASSAAGPTPTTPRPSTCGLPSAASRQASRFITYHGWWSLGRSFDLSLASPLGTTPGIDQAMSSSNNSMRSPPSAPTTPRCAR